MPSAIEQLTDGETSERDVQVLIAGGGPTGLFAAYLLSKLGVRSLVIEKYPERLAEPKSHVLCSRTLEICRQLGLDVGALRKLGSRREDAFWVQFLTNLSGEQIGVLPLEDMTPGTFNYTPEMIHNVPQPKFEAFITEALSGDPNVEIRKGVAFVSCEQSGGEIVSTVEERSTKSTYEVRSKYLIGCDGAKSQIRRWLGVESEGEDSYETMMTIHFNADLRPVVKDRVGTLHWITDPACSGFIIAYDLGGNQVLINNFDSEKYPVGSWNEEIARDTIRAAIGRDDVPFQVLSYRPWVLSRKVAKQYQVGNVFLAGDAAHAFPPTGGLGLNSGLADVHNLAYKIAAVLQGWAHSSILATYVEERRPVAMDAAEQSIKNGKQIFSFLKMLGTAGIKDEDEARENLLRTVRDPAKQSMIAKEVEAHRDHFANLEIRIGYVYGEERSSTQASQYTPKFRPGARLPHAWINIRDPTNLASGIRPGDVSYVTEFTPEEVALRRFSTLDLCPFDTFTLLVGSPKNKWMERFDALQSGILAERKVKLRLCVSGTGFEFVDEKHAALFDDEGGFKSGGGLLVRPDQHILEVLGPEDTAEHLEMAVRGHIGF